MNSPLTSSQFVRLLDKRLNGISMNEYENLHPMLDEFYNVVTDKQAWLEFWEIGEVPNIPEFNGSMEVVSLAPGFHTRIETKEYAAQLIAERKLIDDEQYGVLDDRASKLMKAAMRTIDEIKIEFLTEAFSNAFSYMRKEEGVALCSSSHATKSGVSTASGFDNAGSTALSKTSLAATRLAMRQFRNDIGKRIDTGTDFAVIVPSALADTAHEIIDTPQGYAVAAQTKNVEYQRYRIIEVPLLDDYDANDWFMADVSRAKDNLVYWNRISPEPHNTVDWNTFQLLQAIYFRCGWGWKGWRWIYGHQVS